MGEFLRFLKTKLAITLKLFLLTILAFGSLYRNCIAKLFFNVENIFIFCGKPSFPFACSCWASYLSSVVSFERSLFALLLMTLLLIAKNIGFESDDKLDCVNCKSYFLIEILISFSCLRYHLREF